MDFWIKKASEEDYGAIADLIETVWNQMEEKDWFVIDGREETVKKLQSGKAVVFCAIERQSGCMAGIFLTCVPGLSHENLGGELGFSPEQMEQVIHMDSAAVLPEYQGHGLQRRLMEAAEADARNRGFTYLLCTVCPDNHYSLANVLSEGYRIEKTTELYGGRPRHILVKKAV